MRGADALKCHELKITALFGHPLHHGSVKSGYAHPVVRIIAPEAGRTVVTTCFSCNLTCRANANYFALAQ